MEKILILGKGGHAKSLVDTIEKGNIYEIAGYVINEETELEKYPVIGRDADLERLFVKGIKKAAIGIGYLGNSSLRKELYRQLKKIGYELPVICDPTANIASDVVIGEGTFVGKGAIVNSNSQIGKMCIINTGAIVEHDCNIGEFSHVAVGSVLCGAVNVGADTLIGANATVIQGIQIGRETIIGAGSVVIKDTEERVVIGGVPARNLNRGD